MVKVTRKICELATSQHQRQLLLSGAEHLWDKTTLLSKQMWVLRRLEAEIGIKIQFIDALLISNDHFDRYDEFESEN